ncbi:MAG: ADOP family duplicated permease [Acidobacteriota bacterium]
MRLFRRPSREDDLAEEIAVHLAHAEDEHRRAGMAPDKAHDAALRAFGGALKIRQLHRERRRPRWAEAFRQDTGFAVRTVRRHPGFAITAMLVLGLGLGVNNMLFTIIYGHTLRGLPIEQANRVLHASFVDQRGADLALSFADYQHVRDGATLFAGVAAMGPSIPVALGDPGRAPDRYLATSLSSNALDTLHVRPLLGRGFTPQDDQAGTAPVALLGAGAWAARYGSDPAVLGRDVLIDGRPTTVVGVLAEASGVPSPAEIWLPAAHSPGFSATSRAAAIFRVFGRVRDDAPVDQAAAQMASLLAQAAAAGGGEDRRLPRVVPISARFLGRPTDPAWLAFITAGFLVLLVSCANAGNLMLAHGVRRSREIAIRGSLGASRARLFLQLLSESLVLAMLGGVVGLALSMAATRVFASAVPEGVLPYWLHYSMDGTVFGALVVASFLTVLVFGLVPALQASRTDVSRVLKDGGWGGTGRLAARRWTTAFTALQIGLSAVLLSYVVMEWRTRSQPPPSDAAIERGEVLTAAMSLPAASYATAEQRRRFLRAVSERFGSLPGVLSFALTSTLPRYGAVEQRLLLDARAAAPDQRPTVWSVAIGPGYFDTWRLPLVQGREFTDTDTASDAVAIVNRRFAALFFPDSNPIGRHITVVSPSAAAIQTPRSIVGVSQDIRHRSGIEVDPLVYLPLDDAPPVNVSLLVRSAIDPAVMARQLRDSVLLIDAAVPLHRLMTMRTAAQEAGWNARVSARLVSVLALIVLALSGVGLYAVVVHAVSQRTKEFGIRVSMGARPSDIRRLVLSRVARQVGLGLVVGVLSTLAWDRAFFGGEAAGDLMRPAVLLSSLAVLTAITLVASLIPVRRATRLNPVVALKLE